MQLSCNALLSIAISKGQFNKGSCQVKKKWIGQTTHFFSDLKKKILAWQNDWKEWAHFYDVGLHLVERNMKQIDPVLAYVTTFYNASPT